MRPEDEGFEDEAPPAVAEATVFVVPDGVEGRADRVLADAFPEHSRTALQRAFEAGLVWIAGRPARPSQRAEPGMRIEFLQPKVVAADLVPVDIPLRVLHEDRHLLVVDKPSGMVVHPGAGTGADTLVHALLHHCAGRLSGIGGVERPGIVHRLDRETSGAIVVAKTDRAHRALAEQFAARTVEKTYGALVRGVPTLDTGTVDAPLERDPHQRHRQRIAGEGQGREAATVWRVQERFVSGHAWLLCRILTGRTHQIRVHLESIRHPLVGDRVYGWTDDGRIRPAPPRVMLHAWKLAFDHPVTGARLECEAPWPQDFVRVAGQLRDLPLPKARR